MVNTKLCVIVIFATLGLCAQAVTPVHLLRNEWTVFKLKHDKQYDTFNEERYRLKVYLNNRNMIEEHNRRFELGLETYTMGVNHLADLTYEEALEQYAGYRPLTNETMPDPEVYDELSLWSDEDGGLESFDWRQKMPLGQVKNQGGCGSCWAFSALTTLEHHLMIHKQTSVQLSEQQLIDCSRSYGNHGCHGGWMEYAYKYIQQNGIAKAENYPYRAIDAHCRYQNNMRATSITGYVTVPGGEAGMQYSLESKGPLAVAIHTSKKFMYYRGGVYNDPDCTSTLALTHAVVVVGHGQEGDDKYWIVQNSWGNKWGENGYIRMSKDKNNQCGIARSVSYPTV